MPGLSGMGIEIKNFLGGLAGVLEGGGRDVWLGDMSRAVATCPQRRETCGEGGWKTRSSVRVGAMRVFSPPSL